jgi:hypothetical protein
MPIAHVHPDDDKRDPMPFAPEPVVPIRTGKCRGCGKATVFAVRPNFERDADRPDSYPGAVGRRKPKIAPLDPAAVCFIVTVDAGTGEPVAITLKEFLTRVRAIITTDGKEVPASRIRGIMVSHFATCTQAKRFSGKTRKDRSEE